MVRTRSAAAALAGGGYVRVNGARIDAASRPVRLGDVLTIALDRRVRVLKVTGCTDRRGAAEAARLLYEDLSSPPPSPDPAIPARDPGTGRPSKRERRELEQLRGRTDFEHG